MGNVVVVGGSKGIGFEIVRQSCLLGNTLTVLSRTSGQLEGQDFAPGSMIHRTCDVTKDEITEDMLPAEINGLVYCPGSINLRSFSSLKLDVFREDFELNVVGAIKAIKAASKGLKAAKSASVVLFSTVAVQRGMFAHASIAVSKGAVEGLVRTLAAEFAPGIRVNCLAPALTDTPLTKRFFATPEKVEALAKNYPLGRTGKPQDLAAMANFLLTEDASWITGQVIGVDGGMSTVHK